MNKDFKKENGRRASGEFAAELTPDVDDGIRTRPHPYRNLQQSGKKKEKAR